MTPTTNSPGIPTLTGMQETPAPAWKDEQGTMRLVLGFGSDSNDRIIGTVKLGRARAGDEAHKVLAAATSAGWVELLDPVYSNADQRVPTEEVLAVQADRVAWVAKWADFQKAHRMDDEASRS